MPVASTQNSIVLIGWTFIGIGFLSITTFSILYLVQRINCKRLQNKTEKILDLESHLGEVNI